MNDMRIGGMYQFTERTKQALIEQANERGWTPEIRVYLINEGTKSKSFPYDIRIIVLEAYNTAVSGKPLAGTTSMRLKVLLPNASIGTMYVDTTEWEEVMQ